MVKPFYEGVHAFPLKSTYNVQTIKSIALVPKISYRLPFSSNLKYLILCLKAV